MLSNACDMVRGEGKKVVTIGFCWGSWVLYSAQRRSVKIDGIICIHPSLHHENRIGGNYSELLKYQKAPVIVAAAGNDLDWTKPGAEWEMTSKELGYG